MMSDFFDLFFDKGSYSFNRDIKDMHPYQIKRDEAKTTIVHNIVGIREEDISVSLQEDSNVVYLEIKGETKNEVLGSTYNVSSRFSVDYDRVKNIEHYAKDGLLYINVYYKEPNRPKIDIKKIKVS